ncbi:MAG: MarR family transcriptional regulator [Lachnospiraceae bacterium]|nr:MarR family transcriptional regulator [Lachnospiraceae bacterium]
MREIIFLALMDTQKSHWNRSRKGFQELDLSDGQPKVLYILRALDGCVQKDLAKACDIKPSSMTVMLDGLEKKGYVKREETKISGGKRAYKVCLTEEGREMADKVFWLMETIEEETFEGITEEERLQLFSLLRRVRENLDRYCLEHEGEAE